MIWNCRCSSCGSRRSLTKKPEHYVRPPPVPNLWQARVADRPLSDARREAAHAVHLRRLLVHAPTRLEMVLRQPESRGALLDGETEGSLKFLCWFFRCPWLHVTDAKHADGSDYGLYQCPRCKTVSIGSSRWRTR